MPAAELLHWPPLDYSEAILGGHPAPCHPETGEKLWDEGIRLHGAQQTIIASKSRYKQVCGGVRGGKSFIGAVSIYLDYLWRQRLGFEDDRWLVVANGYIQTEEEMNHLHRLLEEDGIPHFFSTPKQDSWKISFPHNAAEIQTKTSADVPKISSKAYRGIVIAEANQSVRDVYENCCERTSQTRGWVLLEGTFENALPWYARMQDEWKKPGAEGETFELPSWDNLVNFPGGREDPEILLQESKTSPERFMERYGGRAGKRSDLVMRYADERFCVRERFPNFGTSFDPEGEVWLFGDPGGTHAYAIAAIQFEVDPVTKAETAWVFDTIYRWNTTAGQIIEECAARPWAKNVAGIVLDFAARQHNSSGAPNTEQWELIWPQKTGQRIAVFTQPVPLQLGYDVHKRALLNSWPEEVAQDTFNRDRLLRRVTDPSGNKLMFAPGAAPALWGGTVDNTFYQGEYALHRQRKNREGTQIGDDPIDADNDLIKALNYGLYAKWGPSGLRQRIDMRPQDWEMGVAS